MSYPTILLAALGLWISAYGAKADIPSNPDDWTDRHSTLLHQGRVREFWTYSGTAKPRSVIFTLVGYVPDLDICELWHKDSDALGIRVLAKKYKALLVTPCPLKSPGSLIGGWGYNAGTCCQSNKSVDDIDFVRQIIPVVTKSLGVGSLPVYAIGHDNGGMLAEALLCYNVVSQVASVGGILTLEPGLKKGYKKCDDVFDATPGKVRKIIKIHVPIGEKRLRKMGQEIDM
ncbi:hypothetical protein FOL47_001396 [Perkinsus chesapeaki]|uniref:Uncharacterized protein n=1 Tax=Perkinsus chesapeaki TaxID=330153 RepID=A0A7J6KSV6_PERCH|nr:hypothetical protein FOL47_001396 [Perkinsus chesapeaki]